MVALVLQAAAPALPWVDRYAASVAMCCPLDPFLTVLPPLIRRLLCVGSVMGRGVARVGYTDVAHPPFPALGACHSCYCFRSSSSTASHFCRCVKSRRFLLAILPSVSIIL